MVIGVSLISMESDGRSSPAPGWAGDDGERDEAAQDETVTVRPGELGEVPER
jgi:hypothetical protein